MVNELVKVLEEMNSWGKFVIKFVKLFIEYNFLWLLINLYIDSKNDVFEFKLKNDNIFRVKLEKFLLNDKVYDWDIFEEYLEVVKDMLVSLINDLEFLFVMDYLNSEDFL